MNNKDETLPCPFCGKLPDVTDRDFCYPIYQGDCDHPEIWRAGCIESAGGCGAEVTGESAQEAITKWENRS